MMLINKETLPNKIFFGAIKSTLNEGKSATFRVKGKSMRLFLEDERDIVKIVAVTKGDIKVKDVVLAELTTDTYVLHRVIKHEGNMVTLMGDGNVKGTETCHEEQIVGKVTEFYRKGRKEPDSVNGLKWRIYSSVWLALKPFRRYILGIYRRLPIRI